MIKSDSRPIKYYKKRTAKIGHNELLEYLRK